MTKKEYERQLEKIKLKNRQLEMKRNLRKERMNGLPRLKFRKPRTSKMVVWAVISMCIQILLFSEYMAVKTGDTSFMYSLVAIPAALLPTILSYMKNSRIEHQMGQFENSGRESQYNVKESTKDNTQDIINNDVDLSDCSDE